MFNCCSTIKSEASYIFKDTPGDLRSKFIILSLVQAPIGIFIRTPLRIHSLFHGDFIGEGYRQSLNDWQIKQQGWSLNKDPSIAPPKFYPIVIKNVISEGIKRIFKIATYPIAVIGLEVAALYGLVDPLKGRIFYGTIERAWANNRGRIEHEYWYSFKAKEYLAFCMQPKTIWDKYNFYYFDWNYHPDAIRSLILRIDNLLKEQQIFFENEGIETKELVTRLDRYKSLIKQISPETQKEVVGGVIDMTYGDDKLNRRNFRTALHFVLTGLKTLEVNRELMFSSQEKKWKQSRTKIDKEKYIKQKNDGCATIYNAFNYLDGIADELSEETV